MPGHNGKKRCLACVDTALPRGKRVAAALSLCVAALGLLGSVMDAPAGDVIATWAGSLLMVAGLALPGLFWFWRNARDQAVIAKWLSRQQDRDELEKILAGQDEQEWLGPRDDIPLLPKRRWGMIIVVMFVLFVLAGAVLPRAA